MKYETATHKQILMSHIRHFKCMQISMEDMRKIQKERK